MGEKTQSKQDSRKEKTILRTWYGFEQKIKLEPDKASGKGASGFLRRLFPWEIKGQLFPIDEENPLGRVRAANYIMDNDCFPIKKGRYDCLFGKLDGTDGGYGSETYKIASEIVSGGSFRKKEIDHLKTMINRYKDNWYDLAVELKAVFADGNNSFSVDASDTMRHFFNTLTTDDEGKEHMAVGLYNCICLIFTRKCDPDDDWEITEDDDRDEYSEYTDAFMKYGRYSYQSNLMLKKLADAGNRYAMFELAQMYYYGKGIATEKRYDKTYELYTKLKKLGWQYPLFLWARADFIIEYFDSRYEKDGTFFGVSIPELDKLQKHSTYEELVKDLLDAEKHGCGSAANLCGNILSGKAIKKEKLDTNTNYKSLTKRLKDVGDEIRHYKIGASYGNTYSYYQLYRIYLDDFINMPTIEEAMASLEKAFSFLESSAEDENPRAVNELALMRIMGTRVFINKKMDDKGDEHIPEAEKKLDAVDEFYQKDSREALLEAYYYLDRIYDSSIKRSDFKWPVNNMIEHIYMNPEFIGICEEKISDPVEIERIKAKALNIPEQLEDLDTAISTLRDVEINMRLRAALERTKAELEKRLK